MGAAYSSLSQTKVLYATSLVHVLLGAKAKFLRRKLLWKRYLKCADPNPCYEGLDGGGGLVFTIH